MKTILVQIDDTNQILINQYEVNNNLEQATEKDMLDKFEKYVVKNKVSNEFLLEIKKIAEKYLTLEPPKTKEEVLINEYITKFNIASGKKYKTLPKVAIKNFMSILKKYSIDDLITAYNNASLAQNHIDSNLQYLTPEFFTRCEKVEMYLNFKATKVQTQQQRKDFDDV